MNSVNTRIATVGIGSDSVDYAKELPVMIVVPPNRIGYTVSTYRGAENINSLDQLEQSPFL